MAVPFSRPCYTGTSSSNNNSATYNNNRRPHRRARQQQQQQQQQQSQQQQQQQQLQPNSQVHPVTRFLYGDGHIQLDNLSLTSRIAFYALYEAWRLLQDLSRNHGGSTSTPTNRRRPASPPPRQTVLPTPSRHVRPTPYPTVRPDIIPRGEEVSTQSSYSCDIDSTQSSPSQSPVKSSGEQVKRQRLMDQEVKFEDVRERLTPNYYQHHTRNYPDMIPSSPCKPNNNNNNNTWSSNYPDLIPNSVCDSMLDSDPDDDDDQEEEEEVDKGVDDVDGGDDEHPLLVGGVDWAKLGNQLCSIASAFESTFYEPATQEQKAIYETFQRIRNSSNSEVDGPIRRENSLSGFAKTICRQVLLSSIWILLKKVLLKEKSVDIF